MFAFAGVSERSVTPLDIKILATGSSGNCYVISDDVTKVMIECGIKYADIMRGVEYNMDGLETALISHHHKDHTLSAARMYKVGFELVMPPECAETLCLTGKYKVYTPQPKQKLEFGTFEVFPFNLVHYNSDGTKCPCYGYFINSKNTNEHLIFATDTAYIKDTFGSKIDYLMLEVNYTSSCVDDNLVTEVEKRRLTSHMSLETAKAFIKTLDRSHLKAIYAIHASASRCDKQEVYDTLKKYAPEVIIP